MIDLSLRKDVLIIPALTLLLWLVVLLDISLVRGIIVFAYLIFVPGFVVLKTLQIKDLGTIITLLLSVGLSLVVSMLVGLVVNELSLLLNFSAPLTTFPMMAAITCFTLAVYFIGLRRGFSLETTSLNHIFNLSNLPLFFVLTTLPILGLIGALSKSVPIILFFYLTIIILCALCVINQKIIPNKYYPLLIFSVSLSILLINLFLSGYVLGDDAQLEYYVFRFNLDRGYWGVIGDLTPALRTTLDYNAMLSVTLLPSIYSVLMNIKTELLFKILYPLLFSLVPVTLYWIYKNETSKLIALLSTFFFIFTINAFFGELIGLNRQIVAELFLMLSILLWLNKTVPVGKKRLLLIIFGAGIAVSHYTIAIVYIMLISIIVIFSNIRPKFDDTFSASTVLSIAGFSFLWAAFSPGSTLTSFIDITGNALNNLTHFGNSISAPGNAGVMYGIPEVFSVASWINLATSGLVTLSLVVGALALILLPRRTEFSNKYRLIVLLASLLFAFSLLFPTVAATLNFTRFYAICLLVLAPCITIGALVLLNIVRFPLNKLRGIKSCLFTIKHGKAAILLITILLCAYFLSQSGVANYVGGGTAHPQPIGYAQMQTSDVQMVTLQFYGNYIQVPDAYSGDWLAKYSANSVVYGDLVSSFNSIISRGFVSKNLIFPLANITSPEQGSLIYLNSLNVEKGIITVQSSTVINTTDLSPFLHDSDLIYTNGHSEVWRLNGPK